MDTTSKETQQYLKISTTEALEAHGMNPTMKLIQLAKIVERQIGESNGKMRFDYIKMYQSIVEKLHTDSQKEIMATRGLNLDATTVINFATTPSDEQFQAKEINELKPKQIAFDPVKVAAASTMIEDAEFLELRAEDD